MRLSYSFWIRENNDKPIYKVDYNGRDFLLYEHYIDQALASYGDDNYRLEYLGYHGICEQVLREFNITNPLFIAEEPQDLYEVRSLS